jgi:hypothetical protein
MDPGIGAGIEKQHPIHRRQLGHQFRRELLPAVHRQTGLRW